VSSSLSSCPVVTLSCNGFLDRLFWKLSPKSFHAKTSTNNNNTNVASDGWLHRGCCDLASKWIS
jgi:hypothetical protein